jgi:hypothetical protein
MQPAGNSRGGGKHARDYRGRQQRRRARSRARAEQDPLRSAEESGKKSMVADCLLLFDKAERAGLGFELT